eukprot:PhM_4_TR10048/c1_g1_i2/m.99361
MTCLRDTIDRLVQQSLESGEWKELHHAETKTTFFYNPVTKETTRSLRRNIKHKLIKEMEQTGPTYPHPNDVQREIQNLKSKIEHLEGPVAKDESAVEYEQSQQLKQTHMNDEERKIVKTKIEREQTRISDLKEEQRVMEGRHVSLYRDQVREIQTRELELEQRREDLNLELSQLDTELNELLKLEREKLDLLDQNTVQKQMWLDERQKKEDLMQEAVEAQLELEDFMKSVAGHQHSSSESFKTCPSCRTTYTTTTTTARDGGHEVPGVVCRRGRRSSEANPQLDLRTQAAVCRRRQEQEAFQCLHHQHVAGVMS